MASRRPLIVNPSAGQIQELTDSDDLSLPNSSITAESFVGGGTIPVGGIIMWSGTIAQIASIPGWELCDGNNGTPDLRNTFIIGAHSDQTVGVTTAAATLTGANTKSGGSKDAVVVDHKHTITDNGHQHTLGSTSNGPSTTQTGYHLLAGDQNINSENTGNQTTGISIDNEGVSGTNANLPPYYALAYIMRTV